MFNFFQILILLLSLCLVISWLKPQWLRLIATIPAAFFIGLHISAVYLTGQLADDRFFKHANIDQIQAFGFQFKFEMLLFVTGWVILTVLIYLLVKLIQTLQLKAYFKVLILIVLLVLMLLPKGILALAWQSVQINQTNNRDINEALLELGIDPNHYIKPHQIEATSGKNIIVISLESIEKGFLEKPLNHLMPKLTALAEQWTYFNNMIPIKGSDWTAGSLYTLFTGLPAFFNQEHFNNNNLFQNSQEFQLTSLSHVLQAAGYQVKYLMGKPEFAGISSILNTLGIEVVSEHNSLDTYPEALPGLHDKDLFNEAKLQIQAMSQATRRTKKPFALFMSTINTHFPNGIMDERMRGLIPDQDNQLEFALSATDYLLDDFIQFLQQQDSLENTVVYIFPDHKMMGNTGEINRKLNNNPRKLYLISSAEASTFGQKTNQAIYQTDLAPMIMAGAGIKTNAKFLSELNSNSRSNEYIIQNTIKLAALNNAALSRKQFNQGFTIDLANQLITVSSTAHKLAMPLTKSFNLTEVYQVIFSANMVPLEQEKISLSEAYATDHIDPVMKLMYLQTYIQNGTIRKVVLSNRQGIELTKTGQNLTFNAEEISSLIQQVEAQVAQLQDIKTTPIAQYAKDPYRYIAHAGGAIDGHQYTNSLEALNYNYKQGFKLFELDIQQTSDGHFVATHDWPKWQQQTKYPEALPPSHEVFMQQAILDKYTPLDMLAINKWFQNHPDAILVTDKVNSPTQFSEQFIDKERLMMELFSWQAVNVANKLNILAVIPTGDLLFKIPGDKIKYLNDLGIEYLAISRRWSEKHPMLLKKLNQAGFKIFAFHINFDQGKDEKFVTCHERDLFYGLYADHWSFKASNNCQK